MSFGAEIENLNRAVMDHLGVEICINDGNLIETVSGRLIQEAEPMIGNDGRRPMPHIDVIAHEVRCLNIRSGNQISIGEQRFEVVSRDPVYRGRMKIHLRPVA